MRRTGYLILCITLSMTACSAAGQPSAAPVPTASASPSASISELAPPEKESWRKERYVSVNEAVRRLEEHIDEKVVLPRDLLAGIRNYNGWLADPRYIDWERRGGEVVGGLVLRKRKLILGIDFGYAASDGCGDRETAIPTEVDGSPALLWIVPDHTWSRLVWPVSERGSTGRYGLSGTFDGGAMLRLAESMETQMDAAAEEKSGC